MLLLRCHVKGLVLFQKRLLYHVLWYQCNAFIKVSKFKSTKFKNSTTLKLGKKIIILQTSDEEKLKKKTSTHQNPREHLLNVYFSVGGVLSYQKVRTFLLNLRVNLTIHCHSLFIFFTSFKNIK
jgi:hypothetical protein